MTLIIYQLDVISKVDFNESLNVHTAVAGKTETVHRLRLRELDANFLRIHPGRHPKARICFATVKYQIIGILL